MWSSSEILGIKLINNYSSSLNGLWVNSPWGYEGYEGERNNNYCFSKIQLAGQKYQDKTI